MAKKSSSWIPGKNDPDYAKIMNEIAAERRAKRLEIKIPSLAEMQRLQMRTEAWQIMLEELKTKQRKENLKW